MHWVLSERASNSASNPKISSPSVEAFTIYEYFCDSMSLGVDTFLIAASSFLIVTHRWRLQALKKQQGVKTTNGMGIGNIYFITPY